MSDTDINKLSRIDELVWREDEGSSSKRWVATENREGKAVNKRILRVGSDDNQISLYEEHQTGLGEKDWMAVTENSGHEEDSATEWVRNKIVSR